MPKLSIVMPVHNAQPHLSMAIESILSQSMGEFELLCIDDGSSDGSSDVLRAFSQRDQRVLYLPQENKGVSASRNRGLDHATGDYICFADADDFLLPESLERRLTCLEERQASVCGGRALIVDARGDELGVTVGRHKHATFRDCWGVPFIITTIMGRAEVMKSARFPEDKTQAEDWAYIVSLLRQGLTIVPSGESPVVAYRWYDASATSSNRYASLLGCLQVLDTLAAFPSSVRAENGAPTASMISKARIREARFQRLAGHIVDCIFRDQTDGLDAFVASRMKRNRGVFKSHWSENIFSTAAVRAFQVPLGSPELSYCVAKRAKHAFPFLDRLPATLENKGFSVAFRRYLISHAREHRNTQPSFGQLWRYQIDRISFTSVLAGWHALRYIRRLVSKRRK
ncbi:MAG: glycosyltransferase family 2 protein [Pseudomonadota bacterium]